VVKLFIKEDEAKFIHQKYYSGDFEIIQIKRSGWYDFPPLSFAYGLSDLGSWDGLMSTDGKKVVVTKSAYINLADVKEVFEFNKSDIANVDVGTFKTTLTLKNKVKKLTKGSVLTVLLVSFGYLLYIIPGLILSRVLPNKLFQYRPSKEFKNNEKFNSLLSS
jgi:hypothetical protein